MDLQQTIETALRTALERHAQSQYGVVANVQQSGQLTRVNGYFFLGSVAADLATAVQAQLSAASQSPAANTNEHVEETP